MLGVLLQWKRCPDGVEVHDYGPERESRTIAGPPKSGIWFRSRSARRESIRLDIPNLEDPMLLRFLNLRGDDEFAEFFGRFGMLLENDDREVERAASIGWQNELATVLEKASSGEPMLAIRAVNKALKSHAKFASYPLLEMAANSKTPRLTLQPQSLLGLMLMEASIIAANDVRSAGCKNCGKKFITGSLTGRRAHARFCSDRCRVAAMRKRKAVEA